MHVIVAPALRSGTNPLVLSISREFLATLILSAYAWWAHRRGRGGGGGDGRGGGVGGGGNEKGSGGGGGGNISAQSTNGVAGMAAYTLKPKP